MNLLRLCLISPNRHLIRFGILAFTLMLSGLAHSQTVTSSANEGPGSLRAVIQAAGAGNIITFDLSEDTIRLSSLIVLV